MPIGQCKLCLKTKVIRRSHLVPRALYEMSRDTRAKKPDPVLMTRRVAVRTNRQIEDYVLCGDCEQRFNKNGEDWILRHVDNGKHFPLLQTLKLAIPFRATQRIVAFSGAAVGIDTEKLAYFALSVLWRSSVHEWRILGQTTSVSLGVHEEPVRKYLLGEDAFPSDVHVLVVACTDLASRGSFYVPGVLRHGLTMMYVLLTRGIYFRVHAGGRISPQMRELCCLCSPHKPIFMRDCEDKTTDACGPLFSTARITEDLLATYQF